MEQIRQQLDDQPQPGTGIGRDMQRLRGDASATAAELREFVSGLKGRSPQEVLGAIGESSLFQGIAQATIGCVVVLIVFTVGPYFWNGPVEATAETAKPGPAAQTSAASATPDAASATTATAASTTSSTPTGSDIERAAKAMNMDETKESDPKVNPLDKNLDSLLDGLE